MTDSDTARAATRPDWMKDWGQFIVLLVALGGFYGFIRSDMSAMEGRLGDRIDRNAEAISQVRGEVAQLRGEVAQLREGLAQVREEVAQVRGEVAQLRGEVAQLREGLAQVREEVAHLEGYVRGRLGDEPG